jgi:response regulator RpfG family c-di-GMP phosphodiesterase
MSQNTKYLLLVDPQAEVLNLQETALSCFYGGEVLSLSNPSSAYDVLKEKGSPEMIIVDSQIASENGAHFVNELLKNKISAPIIATSSGSEDKDFIDKYPSIKAVIEKLVSSTSFSHLVKSLTSSPNSEPTHVPIKTSVLTKMGMGHFDLFLKLSETNFVKILHQGEPFLESDAVKLNEKSIFELFIKVEDTTPYLAYLEKELGRDAKSSEDVSMSVEDLEAFERVAKYMNWTPAVLQAAHRSVNHAVKIFSKDQNVIAVIKKRLSGPASTYSRHVGLQAFLVCAFSSSVGWVGESGQIKLALASLIHDVAVDDKYYDDIKSWNKRAADLTDKSPETIKYRMHPFEASKLVNTLATISPDVEQIILQHHEVKDGTGFPRAMDSRRIGHLPAIFIMVEDLVGFIESGESIETSIIDFITWGKEYYDAGHFKKVFQAFEEKLRQP